jgi:hypothetical protein
LTIAFPAGNEARAVCSARGNRGARLSAALQIPPPAGLLLLHGGAAPLTALEKAALRPHFQAVARFAAAHALALIDGGTAAGVMELMGEAWAITAGSQPLIGVCPAARVSWPGGPESPDQRAPLEPHHTHFILTPGTRWGDETRTMLALSAALAGSRPSAALIVNGGPIAWQEVRGNVRQQRPLVVFAGSGRLADQIAEATKNAASSSQRIAALVQKARLTLIDQTASPQSLQKTLNALFFPEIPPA